MSTSPPSVQATTNGSSSHTPPSSFLDQSLEENQRILSGLLGETYGREVQKDFASRRESVPQPSKLAWSLLTEALAREVVRERCTQIQKRDNLGEMCARDPTRVRAHVSNVSTGWRDGDGSNGDTIEGYNDLMTSAMSGYVLLNLSRSQTQGESVPELEVNAFESESKGSNPDASAPRWGWGSTIAATVVGTGFAAATAYSALQLKAWYEGNETDE